jgi:hypothetical protein
MIKKTNKYKRSTPVIRLLRNVEKLERNGELVLNRLISWSVDGDGQLDQPTTKITKIMSQLAELREVVEKLEDSGYVPPKRSSAISYDEGDPVSVSPKHRGKYEEAFEKVISEDPNFLDELVVVRIMESGEITVTKGKRTPFIVRKSHLMPREED